MLSFLSVTHNTSPIVQINVGFYFKVTTEKTFLSERLLLYQIIYKIIFRVSIRKKLLHQLWESPREVTRASWLRNDSGQKPTGKHLPLFLP